MDSLKNDEKDSCDSSVETPTITNADDKTIESEEAVLDENRQQSDSQGLSDKLEIIAGIKNIQQQQLHCLRVDSLKNVQYNILKEQEDKQREEEERKKQEFKKSLDKIASIEQIKKRTSTCSTDTSVNEADKRDSFRYSIDESGNIHEMIGKLDFIGGIPQIKRLQSIDFMTEQAGIDINEQSEVSKKDTLERKKLLGEIIEYSATLKRDRKSSSECLSGSDDDISVDSRNDKRESLSIIDELNEDIKDTLCVVTDTKSNRLSWRSVASIELLQDKGTDTATVDDDDEYMYHFDEHRRQAVTKTHFVPTNDRDSCQACSTPFTKLSFRRPHHCRRCGDIFCGLCLLYRKKLNVWAQPDSHGILCKVCIKCYSETEKVLFGIKRSLTEDFVNLRRQCKTERRHILCDLTLEKRNGSVVPAPWKEQFHIDIPRECSRLLSGFKLAVGSSDAQKAIHEMAGSFLVPTWQRAKYWTLESTTLSCRECGIKLKTKKYRNCRVCALALCKKCSYKELLIYYEDGVQLNKESSPRLAVIKVIGCPEREPRYSLRMAMCRDCRDYIVERQQENPDWFIVRTETQDPDLITQLLEYDRMFRELMTEIHQNMEKIPDAQELPSPEPMIDSTNSEIIDDQIEAIHTDKTDAASIKESLKTSLNKYYEAYQKMRTIITDKTAQESRAVVKLTKNYLQARHNFYIKYRSRESAISIDKCPTSREKGPSTLLKK